MSEEIKRLFDKMMEYFEWGIYDMGEAVGHFEDVAKMAYEIVMMCNAMGIELQHLDVAVDPTWPEERKMCAWAAMFARLGEKLYKPEVPCLMHLVYKLYHGYKAKDDIIETLKMYVQK